MNYKYAFIALLIATPLFAWAQTQKLWSEDERQAQNNTRACYPKIGDVALTLAATTGADADSGALNLDSMYMMSCDTDAWIRFGASAVTAVADDWLCRTGEVYFIPTGGPEKLRHISALSSSSNGDVRLIECY